MNVIGRNGGGECRARRRLRVSIPRTVLRGLVMGGMVAAVWYLGAATASAADGDSPTRSAIDLSPVTAAGHDDGEPVTEVLTGHDSVADGVSVLVDRLGADTVREAELPLAAAGHDATSTSDVSTQRGMDTAARLVSRTVDEGPTGFLVDDAAASSTMRSLAEPVTDLTDASLAPVVEHVRPLAARATTVAPPVAPNVADHLVGVIGDPVDATPPTMGIDSDGPDGLWALIAALDGGSPSTAPPGPAAVATSSSSFEVPDHMVTSNPDSRSGDTTATSGDPAAEQATVDAQPRIPISPGRPDSGHPAGGLPGGTHGGSAGGTHHDGGNSAALPSLEFGDAQVSRVRPISGTLGRPADRTAEHAVAPD